MRRVLATALVAVAAATTAVTATPAQAGTCTNEPGDVYVLNVVGIDKPGPNGWYAACVLGGAYGVAIYPGPGGSTCVALIVNDGLVGGC